MIALIGFVAGIALSTFLAELPDWRMMLLLASPGLACVGRPPSRIRLPGWIGLGAGCLLLGLGYAAWHAEARMNRSLAEDSEGRTLELVVLVRGLVTETARGVRFLAEVEQVVSPGARVPPLLRLSAARHPDWVAGSRWRIGARLRGRRATANPAGFDAEQWLWGQGILASGHVQARLERLADRRDVVAVIDRMRAHIAQRVYTVLSEPRAAALVAALTVGDQQGIAREDWRLFARTGVTHLVSISGVHVGMVAGMFAWLVKRLLQRFRPVRMPLRIAVALSALFAAGAYSLLAGWSEPTRRTFFMLAVAGACLLWRRALPPFHLWWLALCTVLLLDPFAVFAPGLVLSFGLVAALMLVVAGRRRPAGKLQTALLGQWAATLLSIVPLTAYFAALPLVSPLANLVAIPLVSVVLSPLSLLAVALPFDGLIELAGWAAMRFYALMEVFARAPLWQFGAIPWYYLLLGLLGTLWLSAPPGMPARGLGALLLIPMFAFTPVRPPPGGLWVSVLDVGQGTSVLLRTARHALLYDTGALSADSVVLPALAAAGVRRLQMLVLSHHDSDHDGAAEEIVRSLVVDEIRVGQMASAAAFPRSRCAPERRWVWDGVQFEFLALLAPDGVENGNNARSCVLRVQNRHQALLLAGDIPASVEGLLVGRYGRRLASSVLLAPHHGSKTSSSERFLRAVAPRWAIVSAGYRNRYGHPHAVVLARYRAHGIEVLRTDHAGALEIRFEPTLQIHGYRQTYARYWRPR